jgi:transcriptional regulator with XRE-family HTH domain
VPRDRATDLSVDEAFGRVIRLLRTKRGLSQEALGHASASGRTYISELERGHKGASLKTVFRIANELGVRPSELVRRVEKLMSE